MSFGVMSRTAAITIAVYFTNRVSSWGGSKDTDRLLRHLAQDIQPLGNSLRNVMPVKLFTLPEDIGLLARKYCDKGAEESKELMNKVPEYTDQFVKKLMDSCGQLTFKKPIDEAHVDETEVASSENSPKY